MFEHSRLPTDLHLCGRRIDSGSFILFLDLAKIQSTTIAAFCVKRRKLSNSLIYPCLINVTKAIECTSNGGFTPPSLPLPYTRGSLILNCHYSSCSDSFFFLFPSETTTSCPSPSGGRECCDLRPRALEPDSDTPHGLPLWASTHNARRCMHAWLEEDVIQRIRQDAAGNVDMVWWLDSEAGGCLDSMRCWRYEEGLTRRLFHDLMTNQKR